MKWSDVIQFITENGLSSHGMQVYLEECNERKINMNGNSSRAVLPSETLELATPLLHININVFISIIHHPYAQRNVLCWVGGNIMFQLRISLLLRHLIALLAITLLSSLPGFFFPPLNGETTTNVTSLRITTAWERASRMKFILHSHARIFTIFSSWLRNIICLFCDLFTV